ncbi:hypothetical protein NPIL_642911, partial [Nephila pilipes]
NQIPLKGQNFQLGKARKRPIVDVRYRILCQLKTVEIQERNFRYVRVDLVQPRLDGPDLRQPVQLLQVLPIPAAVDRGFLHDQGVEALFRSFESYLRVSEGVEGAIDDVELFKIETGKDRTREILEGTVHDEQGSNGIVLIPLARIL